MDEFPDYKHRPSTIVGCLLIGVGGITLIMNFAVLGLQYGYIVNFAFWNGAVCIGAGIIGILAGHYKTRRMIRAFLIDCVVTAVSCVVQMAFAIYAAQLDNDLYDKTHQSELLTSVGLNSAIAAIGILGFGFSIVGLVLAAVVLCPCCGHNAQYQSIGGHQQQ